MTFFEAALARPTEGSGYGGWNIEFLSGDSDTQRLCVSSNGGFHIVIQTFWRL